MVFLWFSYELWGSLLPNLKAILSKFKSLCHRGFLCFFPKTFNWISLLAGLQFHHDPVEISIRFLWCTFGFLMNCDGVSCQNQKHFDWHSITLPSMFPLVFLWIWIECRLQQAFNFTTILLRFQFVSHGFLLVVIWIVRESPAKFQSIHKQFQSLCHIGSIWCSDEFQLIFASIMPPTSPRSCWDFNLFRMVFLWFSYELWGSRLPNFKVIRANFQSLCYRSVLWLSF